MAKIIIEALKLAPRFLWQLYIQPSRVYDYFNTDRKSKTISLWTFFMSGLLIGISCAIPYYLLYRNLIRSIIFATIIAVSFELAFLFTFVNKFSFAFAIAFTFAFKVAFPGANLGSITGLVPFIFTFILTFGGAYLFAFALASAFEGKGAFAGAITLIIPFFLSVGGALSNSYETLIYPLSYLFGYYFNSSFEFAKKKNMLKLSVKSIQSNENDKRYFFYQNSQMTVIIWGTIFAIFFSVLFFLDLMPESNNNAQIAALGFLFIAIIILHIPDYLLCLPLWIKQKKMILSKNKNLQEQIREFEKSLPFEHEMLFFQLPGLHTILVTFARNKKINIKYTLKSAAHLYLFSFQRKQVRKAVLELLKNKELSHHLFIIFLESKCISLLDDIAQSNKLAYLYYGLTDINVKSSKVSKRDFFASLSINKNNNKGISTVRVNDFFPVDFEKREFKPKSLKERLEIVFLSMANEEGYLYNNEMVKTLQTSYQLLTSKNSKDISTAIETLLEIKQYPEEIDYFAFINSILPSFDKVRESLQKMDIVERTETRRSILHDQMQYLATLLIQVEKNLFEPFKNIWLKGLERCQEILDAESKILQGSAVLFIQLKNNEIPASMAERKLYFEITNKGQELASHVSLSLQSDNTDISFPDGLEKEIDFIEAGSAKVLFVPIHATKPCQITLQGTLRFDDLVSSNKQIPFSFPLYVRQMAVAFKEILNPYIAGNSLKGETPLFFGREDAHDYIDKNILASGDHHTFVCHGLRRSGKTSLLYRIESQGFSDKRLAPVFIDMQGIDNEADFYASVTYAIQEKLSLHATTTVDSFSRFKQFLKEIELQLSGRIIVLMLDEFEELQMRVEDGRISRTIFSNLRHLMQHEDKLIFLFCGCHKIEEMAADYWSIFFNTAVYYRLSHLNKEDAIRLITEPVKGQLNYDHLAVDQILKMTGGQPYLIQLICRTLVNDLNEKKQRNDALIDDVDDAIDKIIATDADHFSQHIWQDSSTVARVVLSAMADVMTRTQNDRIGVEGIYTHIQMITDTISRKEMMETLNKLVSQEIIAETNLVYHFPVNLLRKWVAAQYPLRKIREEI